MPESSAQVLKLVYSLDLKSSDRKVVRVRVPPWAQMKNIYKILEELGIQYKEFKHPPVFTIEEAEKHRTGMDGPRIKNLFLRNKQGNKNYLLVTDAFKKIDLKDVGDKLDEKKIGFASADRLKKYLGVTPGAVSPLGLINDVSREVILVLDKELFKEEKLNFHPNVNTATVQISKEDFKKFIKWRGNKLVEIEI